MKLHISPLVRDDFGALHMPPQAPDAPEVAALDRASKILMRAIAAGKLDKPFVDVDRKHRGAALNYDIYDCLGGRVLIQRRYTVCSKYGNSPTKSYLLLRTIGRGIVVEDWDMYKPRIMKMAKKAGHLGEVITTLIAAARY